jgi:hypothetical protein
MRLPVIGEYMKKARSDREKGKEIREGVRVSCLAKPKLKERQV